MATMITSKTGPNARVASQQYSVIRRRFTAVGLTCSLLLGVMTALPMAHARDSIRHRSIFVAKSMGGPDMTGKAQSVVDVDAPGLVDWFAKYDDIRRTAQMSEEERQLSDKLLGRGLGVLLPGFGRIAAQRLLKKMVERYETASRNLGQLPEIEATKQLQQTYIDYFTEAGSLFVDCRRMLHNPLARSKKYGFIKRSLKKRRKKLVDLENKAKTLDEQSRSKYGIADYQFSD